MLQNPASSTGPKLKSANSANEEFMRELRQRAGLENAGNQTGKSGQEKNEDFKKIIKTAALLQASQQIPQDLRNKLDGWRLDTHSTIDEASGKLQIKGDDGNYRDASFQEKVVLEKNTKACSIGTTEDEIQMQQYLKGEIDSPPAAFKELAEDWAKENGTMDPNTMTRDDYNRFITEEFPHHATRMQYGDINVTLGYGDGATDLLSQLSKDSKTDWDKVEATTETMNPTGRLSTHPDSMGNGIASKFTNFASPAGVLKPTETKVTFDSTGPNAPTLQ